MEGDALSGRAAHGSQEACALLLTASTSCVILGPALGFSEPRCPAL